MNQHGYDQLIPMEDAQDELDELVDNNPAGCHFQLI
jgi:hypothetical protein